MTAPMNCQGVGRWRIVEADLLDRDYLDLVGPATIIIATDGHGEIAFRAPYLGIPSGRGELLSAVRRSSPDSAVLAASSI